MEDHILRKLQLTELDILEDFDKKCKECGLTWFLEGGTLLGAYRHGGFIPWDDDIDVLMPRKDYEKLIKIVKKERWEGYYLQCIETDGAYWNFYAKLRKNGTTFITDEEKNMKTHSGVFIDIFPMDAVDEKQIARLKRWDWLQPVIRSVLIRREGMTIQKKEIFSPILWKFLCPFTAPFSNAWLQEKGNFYIKSLDESKASYYYRPPITRQDKKMNRFWPIEKVYPVQTLLFEEYEFPVFQDYKWYLEQLYGKDYMRLPPKEQRVAHNAWKIELDEKGKTRKSELSVIVTTYNGEFFLEEQLDSIRNQTRPADEVLILDDCSTDRTFPFVQEYIVRYGLTNWKAYRNEHNCGWERNFMQGIGKASGDYIFLADQDDVWKPEKLQVMSEIMDSRPEIAVLASNYTPFYMENALDKARNAEKMENTGRLEPYPFDSKFLYVRRPGCVYCIKKEFANALTKYWFEGYPHDAFFWRMAGVMGKLYVYYEPLILFRRHANNASAVVKTSLKKKTEDAEYYRDVLRNMEKMMRTEHVHLDKRRQKTFRRVFRFCDLRYRFLRKRDFLCGIRLCAYLDCYYALKTFLADWFVLIFHKEIKR